MPLHTPSVGQLGLCPPSQMGTMLVSITMALCNIHFRVRSEGQCGWWIMSLGSVEADVTACERIRWGQVTKQGR